MMPFWCRLVASKAFFSWQAFKNGFWSRFYAYELTFAFLLTYSSTKVRLAFLQNGAFQKTFKLIRKSKRLFSQDEINDFQEEKLLYEKLSLRKQCCFCKEKVFKTRVLVIASCNKCRRKNSHPSKEVELILDYLSRILIHITYLMYDISYLE